MFALLLSSFEFRKYSHFLIFITSDVDSETNIKEYCNDLYDNDPRHERVNVDINPTGVFFSSCRYLLELKQFGMVGNSSHSADYSTSYALCSYRLYSYFRIASNSLFQPMFITFSFIYVYFPTLCINPLTINVPII